MKLLEKADPNALVVAEARRAHGLGHRIAVFRFDSKGTGVAMESVNARIAAVEATGLYRFRHVEVDARHQASASRALAVPVFYVTFEAV